MDDFDEYASKPVSPMAHYFSCPMLNVFVLGVLESEIPIDDSRAVPLLREVFLPLNTRFSSVMIVDNKGEKRWKQVDVRLNEHIKIPVFPTDTSLKLYDKYFDEYMSKLTVEPFPEDKPLWQMHIIKYPTSSAAGTFVFKLHHALGDGYSLMATLLNCVQKADDPSVPIKFPSSRRPSESSINNKSMLKSLPQTVSTIFKTAFDFGRSLFRGSLITNDGQTPIRSGHQDLGFRPLAVSNVSLSLDTIKEVKNRLKVSVNDALVGIILLGVRLYMEAMNHKSSKTPATAFVLLNTRKIRAYKTIKEMLDTNSDAPWGNRFYFMHIPIPELSDTGSLNPLEFVLEANKLIMRERYSFAAPLHEVIVGLVDKLKGPEAAARYIYRRLNNASLSISHMVGPAEQVALANHPVKGLYFMTPGLAESVTVTITSYNGYIRIGFGLEKDYIDEHQFNSCFETSLEMTLKAAKNIVTKTK